MKFKLTVLTLLLLGLVFAGNAFAQQSAVLSVVAQDNSEHQIPLDSAVGYPVLMLKLTNTGDVVADLVSLTVQEGAISNVTNDGDFSLEVWKDTNKNGIIDPNDDMLTDGAVAITAAGGDIVLPFDGAVALGAGSIVHFIVTANAAAPGETGLAQLDAVELVVAAGLTDQPFAGIGEGLVTASTTATLDPSDDANTPSFMVGDTDGQVTIASSVSLSDANVGNLAKDQVVAAFKLTADAIVSHLVYEIHPSDGEDYDTPGDMGEDLSTMSLYLDLTPVGTLDVNDILWDSGLAVDMTGEGAFDLTDEPIFIKKGASKNFLITVNAEGNAGVAGEVTIDDAKEDIAFDVYSSDVIVDGEGPTTGDYIGPVIGLVPLFVSSVETKDADLDGGLDALKVSLSAPVNDARWSTLTTNGDLTVWGSTGTPIPMSAFNPIAYGDVANNSTVYVQFVTNNIPVGDRYTNGKPQVALEVTAENSMVSNDGSMALLPFNSYSGYSEDEGGADGDLQTATADKAQPVVIGTSVQDADLNGKIDRAIVTFTEGMNAVNADCYQGVTFKTPVTAFGSNGSYSATSGIVSGNTVTYTITESGGSVYDTESTPVFNYSVSAGKLKDIPGNEVPDYGTGGLAQPGDTIDNARPVIVSIITGDNYTDYDSSGDSGFESAGANGRIDTAVLVFSERLATDMEDDGVISQFELYKDGDVELSSVWFEDENDDPIMPVPEFENNGTYGSEDTNAMLTIYFLENTENLVNGGDTGSLVTFSFMTDGVTIIDDASVPNVMLDVDYLDVPASKLKDGAKPFIVTDYSFENVQTLDVPHPGKMIGDGFIDAFRIFFSEEVEVTDAANVGSLITVDNDDYSDIVIDIGVDADGDGEVDSDDNNEGFTDAIFHGTSSMSPDDYDTANTPTVWITGDSMIKDASGNTLASTGEMASYDTALPVPATALGQVTTDIITVTWSEPVYSNSDGTGDFSTMPSNALFGYLNVNDEDLITINALDTDIISYSPNVMTIVIAPYSYDYIDDRGRTRTMNLTALATEDVANDSLWVMLADAVFDCCGNPAASSETAEGYCFTFNDDIAPVIVDARTLDVDGNGLVDYIRVQFSEDMDDNSLMSLATPNSLTNDLSAQWQLSEYAGKVRANLMENTETGTHYSALTGIPVFDDNEPSDNVIYFALEESKVPAPETLDHAAEGTTGWTPTLTLVNCTLTDKKPNLLATTAFTVKDKAGPVIIWARTLTLRTLEISFSEEVDIETVQAWDFIWTLGVAYRNFQNYVAEIYQTTPSNIVLETIEGWSWEPYMGGTIEYVNEGGIKDLAGNVGVYSGWNAYEDADWWKMDGSDWEIDDSKGYVAEYIEINTDDVEVDVDEAAPIVYSLSKNYPNPFNPTTTIEYSIPVAGNVEMAIYNISGQKVRTLINGVKDVGTYKVMWDGKNDMGESVSSGIYLYKIISGDFSKIEKMTFIK